MIYARCLYQILIWADGERRAEYPISRKTLALYIQHVGQHLESEIVRLRIGNGYAMMLVDLNVEISIAKFVEILKHWTSVWIMGDGKAAESDVHTLMYWSEGYYLRPISAEDKPLTINIIDSLTPDTDIAGLAERCVLSYCEDSAGDDGEQSSMICHHIILITSRSRLLLRRKYSTVLAGIATDVVNKLGLEMIACDSMRNHVHILCFLPLNSSVANTIYLLERNLLEALNANIHFRKFEGWSEDSVVSTVSPHRIKEEEGAVVNQRFTHSHQVIGNEMFYISQRLGIHYVTSLN